MLTSKHGWFAVVVLFASAGSFAMGPQPPSQPGGSLAGNTHFITDSLVNHLQCSTLTKETVLSSFQPDAFSSAHHLPVQNWASGHGLAECWSLAHAQRLLFYMGRFGEKTDAASVQMALNDFSGAYDGDPEIFSLQDVGSLFKQLSGDRRLKKTIESYEDWRFYQAGNLENIIGDRDRDPATNADTYSRIISDLNVGRLPIVIIRAGLQIQHAVVIKGVGPSGFVVYNSNTPSQDDSFSYDGPSREFYAQNIIKYFGVDPNLPVGVFLEDEDPMDSIQMSLFAYYQQRCLAAQSGG